jgi:hypothetical protein
MSTGDRYERFETEPLRLQPLHPRRLRLRLPEDQRETGLRLRGELRLRRRLRLREVRRRLEVTARLMSARGWRALGALLAFTAFSNLPMPATADTSSERIAAHESRFDRARPVIAVVGENAGTELTDFVIPFGVLRQSNAAEVLTVATRDGPIQMWPALRIQPDLTLASLTGCCPAGR